MKKEIKTAVMHMFMMISLSQEHLQTNIYQKIL